ncbi:MAG: hypothetical protein ABIH37_04085 [archaeon]
MDVQVVVLKEQINCSYEDCSRPITEGLAERVNGSDDYFCCGQCTFLKCVEIVLEYPSKVGNPLSTEMVRIRYE